MVRDGAARLTLEAVAAVAGISKASVIYDYKTKQELIKAVIERCVAEEEAALDGEARKLARSSNARILAHLARAVAEVSDDKRAVAVNLCTLTHDAELRSIMQQSLKREVALIAESAENPKGARLAFLAVQGLKFLDLLGLHAWPESERYKILAEIARVAEAHTSTPNASREKKAAALPAPADST